MATFSSAAPYEMVLQIVGWGIRSHALLLAALPPPPFHSNPASSSAYQSEFKTVRQCAADVRDQGQCSYWTGPPWVQPMSMAHCDLLDESGHC